VSCCVVHVCVQYSAKMAKASGPDLTKYMDKLLSIKLNANRHVQGTLRGFDQFMNLVLEARTAQPLTPTHTTPYHTTPHHTHSPR
jgi:hypothetical protein